MSNLKLEPIKHPVVASVHVPGSKSYTNRALLIAAMINNSVVINQPLFSDDTRAMTQCLESLGIDLQTTKTSIVVSGDISQVIDAEYNLNCLLSGTTIRFMLALCAIIPGIQILQGETRLNERPIADMVDALIALGAKIEYLSEIGFPPIRISSSSLHTKPVSIKGSSSSQYVSALLMIAPLLNGIDIRTDGEVISKPYIDMTLATMKEFGVNVVRDSYASFSIPTQQYTGEIYTVEGDVSSASYFFAIAALTKSTITVKNINPNSIQADMGFLKILEQQGNIITTDQNSITVKGVGPSPAHVDMEHCPDQAATLAVLCAFARGKSVISGIQSLRIKETERIVALENELAKMQIATKSTNGTITIHGGNPRSASINTYNDHRMAMTFAVAATKIAGITINTPEVVTKTFPKFWEEYNRLLQPVTKSKNIVLIGMRGSGKTTVAFMLGKLLNKQVIDIDEVISIKAGMKIAQIVSQYGWPYFREQERKAVEDIADTDDSIISTGGGIVLQKQNVDVLKKNGTLFWLHANPRTLIERTSDFSNRPALTKHSTVDAEIKEVTKQRDRLYRDSADHIITINSLGIQQVAELIIKAYKEDRR